MSRDALTQHLSQSEQQRSAELQDANKRLDIDLADCNWLTRNYRDTPVGLCCFDTQLRYLDINEWLAALNGLSVEEHLGRSVSELFPNLAAGIESQLRDVIETGEPILEGLVFAETLAQPRGNRCFQHNYVAIKSDDGTVVGVSCAVIEITERKRAEEALQRAHGELEIRVEQRTAELKETNRELRSEITTRKLLEVEAREHRERLAHVTRLSIVGEIAAAMAHEVNQPLTAISNYCYTGKQAIADAGSPDTKQLQGLFEDLTEQAIRAGEIVRRLRGLVGKSTPVRLRVHVVEPIQKVFHLLESDLHQSDVRVELQADHTNHVASMDEIQIQQVLVNLIRNALDAMGDTERDQRTLKITTSRTANGLIEVAVCDTGKGIPVKSTNQVFDAFFSDKSGGMGMGLAISRTIIESHGGRLWMTPNSDRGVTFHFTLPIATEGSDDEGG